VNEYTRRDEVRWMLLTAVALVLCIAAAIVLLTTARGPMVHDPAARQAADDASAQSEAFMGCKASATKLSEELALLMSHAKTVNIEPEIGDDGKPKPKPKGADKTPDIAWPVAEPTHKYAASLMRCRAASDEATGGKAPKGWDAVGAAAKVAVPTKDDDEAQIKASREVKRALSETSLEELGAAVVEADKVLADRAAAARSNAATAKIRQPLPPGLLGRKAAIATGLGLALVGLLVSFFSVRAASRRRATALIPLRAAAKTTHRGHQAAAILTLSAHHNGGEPGLVLGAAIGGLTAATLSRADADWFVVGVMAGLIIGLVFQLVARVVIGLSPWRARATELSEVEKPTLPIVLVLKGVNEGHEEQFVGFLLRLQPTEAAAADEQLAAQAEERILMEAEAGAAGAVHQHPG